MCIVIPYHIHSYGTTHQGNVREHNEDNFLDLNSVGLWVVADGAGGHDRGEVASQLIVCNLAKLKAQDFLGDLLKNIELSLEVVNQQLIQMRTHKGSAGIIGSTVCILLIHNNYSICIWSGDSRIYLLRQGILRQLTHDHNRMDEFRQAGFSEDELAKYPAARQLIHAIGVEEPLFLERSMQECCVDDMFLLCSDGLYGELADLKILNIMQHSEEAEVIVDNLLKQVLLGRAKDNVTAVLVQLKPIT